MRMKSLHQYLSTEEFDESDVAVVTEAEEGPQLDEDVQSALDEAEVEVPDVQDEVTEDAVIEAEDDIEEADEEIEEEIEELEEAEEIAEEIEEEQASVEHFMTVLQHGIKTKTFSPQFVATAQHKLDKLNETFGGEVGVPSLESYNGDSLEDYYTASLESFQGFMRRLGDAAERLERKVFGKLVNAGVIERFKKKGAAVNTRADDLVAKLNALGNAEEGFTVGKAPKKLLVVGSDNIVASLKADLKLSTAMTTSVLKASEGFIQGVFKVLGETASAGGEGKTGPIIAKALNLKKPYESFPSEAFSSGFVGGMVFEKIEVTGDSDIAKIKSLVNNAYPEDDSNKVSAPEGMTLSKADLSVLLKLAKSYGALAIKTAENSGSKSIEQWDLGYDKKSQAISGAANTSWEEGKSLDALASGVFGLVVNHHHLYLTMVHHVADVGDDICNLVERLIKSYKPAKAE